MKVPSFQLAGALALATALCGIAPALAGPPPPSPPPLDTTTPATPTPVPVPPSFGFPRPSDSGSPNASATPSPTPPPNARKGLEGVWEVEIQRANTTDYTHFKLAQTGNTLSGTYVDGKGKKYPLAGSVDGQAIRLIVSLSDGTTILLEGRLDGTTDMLGMLTTSKEQVPFTAAYRPKEKWIENVNASPGGLGTGGGGGGYTPP